MSWGPSQSRVVLDPCGLWPKVTEEIEGTGFNRLKGNSCVWRPGCVSNHSSTSLSPPTSQGHKIHRVFTVQKSLWALLPHMRGSLPLIITQTIFSRAQQSCPLQLVCLLFALLLPSALRGFISPQVGFLLPSLLWGCGSSTTGGEAGSATGQGCACRAWEPCTAQDGESAWSSRCGQRHRALS